MKENFKKEVSHQLMIIRKDKEVTIEDLSKITGIATSTISRYENGNSNMNLDMIEKLVNALGYTLPIFFELTIAKMQ